MFLQKIFEEMTNADWLIFAVTSLAYLFITLGVKANKGEGQSFFSWLVWIILDIVLFIPTYWKNGKAIFMIMPSIIGSLIISIMLLIIKKDSWQEFKKESTSLFLIVLTVIGWAIFNSNVAIVMGVTSQVIAGWPLTKKTWLHPKPKWTLLGYTVYVISCILLLSVEKNVNENFSLQDHLLAIALGLQTIVDIIPLVGKLISNHKK